MPDKKKNFEEKREAPVSILRAIDTRLKKKRRNSQR